MTPHPIIGSMGRARALGLIVGTCLAASACGSTGDASRPSAAPSDGTGRPAASAPGYRQAYDAGFAVGKRLFEDGGKGAAVREVNGGCVRRSLAAKPTAVVDLDRGAWILGCKQGTGNSTPTAPSGPITRREPDADLLHRFGSWARKSEAADSARHVTRVTLVHLDATEYDVEVTTTYTAGVDGPEVRRLAHEFTRWWDGDDGAGTAWNLIVADTGGQRIATRDLRPRENSS
ncbi:hypothetical protein [Streptomyces rhizosphaerihabitans]|uniref:hypothetical protein n=1 Tax=Streptomyces rhizosphaerihabitans TaxID=1266770 RepID=UPI0021C1C1C8|nr:hypothetical protein [Streptomyces rhizosphaerihabitans]MCT9007670.1 hypothetical protein [Streptomyces rhizosphaerihabitans]